MLDMRRRDDAEGESRMMGSTRFAETAPFWGMLGGIDRVGSCPDFESLLFFGMNSSRYLRTCEKSCMWSVTISSRRRSRTYRWLDPSQDRVSVSHLPLSIVDSL